LSFRARGHDRRVPLGDDNLAGAVILAGGGEAPNAMAILCQYDDSTCIEVGLDIEKVVQEHLSLRFGYSDKVHHLQPAILRNQCRPTPPFATRQERPG